LPWLTGFPGHLSNSSNVAGILISELTVVGGSCASSILRKKKAKRTNADEHESWQGGLFIFLLFKFRKWPTRI